MRATLAVAAALAALALALAPASAEAQDLSGVQVAKDGTGAGTVRSTPAGIECGDTCAAPFDEGTPVTLTAEPESGSRFAGWSGECSGTGECVVTAGPTTSVTATFERQRLLALHAVGTGAITAASPPIFCTTLDCEHTLDQGTEITLTATPAPDHRFVGWDGQGCTGTSPTCEVTLDQDRAIVAYFAAREPALGPPSDPGPVLPKLPPDTQLTRAKVTSSKRKALFRFAGVWGAAQPVGFTCRLDKRKWKRCESPVAYRRLDSGDHVFKVAAIRDDGVVDRTPAKHHFTIRR